jgi:hypothetical protein
MARRRTVLIVTYTLEHPATVGVFFRALRLGFELTARGHRVVVLNAGPVPRDPKVDAARGRIEIGEIPWGGPRFPIELARDRMAAVGADLIVFGEGPFDTMQTAFRAARGQWPPLMMLDQYYQDWLVTKRSDVDLVLLYGLTSFVKPGEFRFGPRFRLIPPFIRDVTPVAELPMPDEMRGEPWVTVLGFEPVVLEKGLELIAALPEPRPAVVALSHDPESTRWLAGARGVDPRRVVTPGLRHDADLFGFMAGGRAVILANGYMQILEALALARPAVCIMRGVGLEAWTVADCYKVYVSIDEPFETQRDRLAGWVAAPPFPGDLAQRLAAERDGARHVADAAEALMAGAWQPAEMLFRAKRVMRSYRSDA